MNVLMLTEYYYPFDFGGSEWSTFYLAKGLRSKGVNVSILTPNYAPKGSGESNKDIFRFPFYKKIKKNELTPFWHTNILWIVWSSFWVLRVSLLSKTDIIHIQGKYFLPAAAFVKFMMNKKIIITLRDYIALCPLGICIMENKGKCTFSKFIQNDIPKYLKQYNSSSSMLVKILIIAAAVRGRLYSTFLTLLLHYCDKIIVLSDVQKRIVEKSGLKVSSVIPNTMESSHKPQSIKKNQLLYAGRLTPGKGISLLVEALPGVIKQDKKLKVIIYGDGLLKSNLKNKITNISQNILFKKRISHQQLLKEIANSRLTVIPSIWPEPFGRLVIESLFANTPVVVTEQTGAAGFIKNKKWGIITQSSVESLEAGIKYAIKNNQVLTHWIKKEKKELNDIFSVKPIAAYKKIYEDL